VTESAVVTGGLMVVFVIAMVVAMLLDRRRVRDVLRGYAAACMPRAAEQAPSPWPSRNDGRRHQTNEHDRSTT